MLVFERKSWWKPSCLADPYSDRLLGTLHGNDWDVAMKLIRKGEGLRWSNFGWTVLHFAVWKAAPRSLISAMLRGGLSANESAMEDGKTPMHYAVQFNPESISLLIEHKGDSNHPDNLGETPLALAAGKGKTSVLEALLQAGGDPNRATIVGVTPLMQAVRAQANSGECVRLLLEHGANRDARDEEGLSALDHARQRPSPCRMVLTLLDPQIRIMLLLCSVRIRSSGRKQHSLLVLLPLELIRSICFALGSN